MKVVPVQKDWVFFVSEKGNTMARGRTYRRKRSDGSWGRWNAVIDLPKTQDGRRRQITRTFDTKRLAHEWLAQQVAGSAGIAGTPSGTNVGQWLTDWIDDLKYAKASTQATYRAHVERYLIPKLGHISLSALTTAEIDGLVDDLHARGLAPATIKRIIATLQAALSSAVRRELLSVNPVRGVRVPQGAGRVHTVWDIHQCATFLAACPSDGLGALYRLALVTGMRRGELLGLSWTDVDLAAATLVVRATRVAIGGRVVTGTPKSRSGVRRIYLDAATVNMLRAWKTVQKSPFSESDGYVFTNCDGVAFTPGFVSHAFNRLIAKLPVPQIRFHDLRHTSATIGLASGESLKEVSARLGHADIAITANVYTEILPQTAQASATRRANLITGIGVVLKEVAS